MAQPPSPSLRREVGRLNAVAPFDSRKAGGPCKVRLETNEDFFASRSLLPTPSCDNDGQPPWISTPPSTKQGNRASSLEEMSDAAFFTTAGRSCHRRPAAPRGRRPPPLETNGQKASKAPRKKSEDPTWPTRGPPPRPPRPPPPESAAPQRTRASIAEKNRYQPHTRVTISSPPSVSGAAQGGVGLEVHETMIPLQRNLAPLESGPPSDTPKPPKTARSAPSSSR